VAVDNPVGAGAGSAVYMVITVALDTYRRRLVVRQQKLAHQTFRYCSAACNFISILNGVFGYELFVATSIHIEPLPVFLSWTEH